MKILQNRIILSLLVAASFIPYFLAQYFTNNLHSTQTAVDQFIPVIPVFVVPYLLFLPFLLLSSIYFVLVSKTYMQFAVSMILCNLISFVIYISFQTIIVHPVLPGNDVFSSLIRWVYGADAPTRTFPSSHTSDSLVLLFYWLITLKNNWLKLALVVFVGLILASTVLIKQHYLADVFGGAALAIFCCWAGIGFVHRKFKNY